jgi:hypothetical protein
VTRKQRADDADGERTGVFTSGIVATHTGTLDRAVLHGYASRRGESGRGARPRKHGSTSADPGV